MFPLLKRRPERALARREPFWSFHNWMDEMFGRFAEGWHLPEEWTEMREWEFEENDKEVIMRLELPGFEPKEIELRLEGNECVVRAEHPENKEEKNGQRAAERFEYRFSLPFGADVSRVEAVYRNGILELHLPRLPEAQPKRIEVKT